MREMCTTRRRSLVIGHMHKSQVSLCDFILSSNIWWKMATDSTRYPFDCQTVMGRSFVLSEWRDGGRARRVCAHSVPMIYPWSLDVYCVSEWPIWLERFAFENRYLIGHIWEYGEYPPGLRGRPTRAGSAGVQKGYGPVQMGTCDR